MLTFLAIEVPATGLPTSEVALVGRFGQGPVDLALEVDAAGFNALFGSDAPNDFPAEVQALQFFRNGGDSLSIVRVDPARPLTVALKGSLTLPRLSGLGALLPLSNLGLLLCPELTSLDGPAMESCLDQIEILGEERPLFTILDPPPSVMTPSEMMAWRSGPLPDSVPHTAVYFPKLEVDPAAWSGGSSLERLTIGASGMIAAVIQKNDASRGIWKAPAGSNTTFLSEGLTVALSNAELDDLNQAGINTLRDLPTFGKVVWGSRTLDTGSENRFLSVVRTRRWIERSLQRELSDAALSANDSTLWMNLELRAEAFLNSLFRQGAFSGTAPNDAYFVKCDFETTTPADIAAHRVNVIVGCAFLRPAEFVVDQISLVTFDASQPDPVIPISASRPVDSRVCLSFPTVPGFVHYFQTSSNLQPASWFDGSEITGDGSWVTLKFPLDSTRSFFRVKTQR